MTALLILSYDFCCIRNRSSVQTMHDHVCPGILGTGRRSQIFFKRRRTQNMNTALHQQSVDIGPGRKMYLECRGSGSPTVVFVSGRSDRADIWSTLANPRETGPAVLPGVATFTRVCAYDRPGTVTITGEH